MLLNVITRTLSTEIQNIFGVKKICRLIFDAYSTLIRISKVMSIIIFQKINYLQKNYNIYETYNNCSIHTIVSCMYFTRRKLLAISSFYLFK